LTISYKICSFAINKNELKPYSLKTKIMKQLVLIFLTFLAINSDAQSTINANGNTATIGGNTYSFSVGEMCAVHTASNGSVVITHGVLQPMSDNSVGINETWLASDKIHVYPNPTSTKIQLELNTNDLADADFVLMDMQGRMVLSKQDKLSAGNNKFEFDLSHLANAYYVLQVKLNKSNATYSKSFKIQKIK